MAIPKEKLNSWSNQGAVVTSKSTHESIRNALKSEELNKRDFEVYLQGSYKNSTNIRGDSDVDVVVQLNSIFSKDISELTEKETKLYYSTYSNATYFLSEFENSVLKVLKEYFGVSSISKSNKCIKIDGSYNRLDADVLVCNQYRKYNNFVGQSTPFIEGIQFKTLSERKIISYPKVHYNNSSNKNSLDRTKGNYKPAVRIFKNARNYLIENGVINTSLASSYFIESLLYNVPDPYFSSDYANTFIKSVNWLGKSLSEDTYKNFVCPNEEVHLFGESVEQWDKNKAMNLIINLSELWENW